MSTFTRNKKLKPEIAADLRLCHRRSWPCWLTAEEVAEMLRVDIGTIYSLARSDICRTSRSGASTASIAAAVA